MDAAPTPRGAARLRPTLVLVGTLLIGMLLGALLNGYVARQRFERLDRMRGPGGIAAALERDIGPMTPEQQTVVRPILERAGARAEARWERSRAERRANQDSLLVELTPHLTSDQLAHLRDEMRRHDERRGRHGRK